MEMHPSLVHSLTLGELLRYAPRAKDVALATLLERLQEVDDPEEMEADHAREVEALQDHIAALLGETTCLRENLAEARREIKRLKLLGEQLAARAEAIGAGAAGMADLIRARGLVPDKED